MKEINNLVINSKNNIIEEYLRIYNHYKNEFCKENVFIFMQVGSFHESYQTYENGPNLQAISNITNVVLTKRNKSIIEVSMKNPYVLGVQSSTVSKYVKILIDANYTVVVIDQVSQPPNIIREITGIYSPSMYIQDTNTQNGIINNEAIYISAIYIDESNDLISKKPLISCGISIIDLTTGKTIISEIYASKDDDKYTLDEIIKFINGYQSKKILLISNKITSLKEKELESYLELNDKQFYHYKYDELIKKNNKVIKPFDKISYQQAILSKVYDNVSNDMIQYLDLENKIYGRITFCILIDYVYEYNPNIIKKLIKPELYDQSNILNLANNAIYQLNLLTYDNNNISGLYNNKVIYKSVFDVLNKTSTPMGKRLLKEMLIQPKTDINMINKYYSIIEKMMLLPKNELEKLSNDLEKILDLERLLRKLSLKVLHPLDLFNLINGISDGIDIINNLLKNNIDIICKNDLIIILDNAIDFLIHCKMILDIPELQKYILNDINGKIFNFNIYKDLDRINLKIDMCNNLMSILSNGLSEYLDKILDSTKKESLKNSVKIESTPSEGHFLCLTKRRAEIFQKQLQKDKEIKIDYNDKEYLIKYENLEFKYSSKGNSAKVFFPMLEKNSTSLVDYIEELKKLNKEYFLETLDLLYKKYSNNLCKFIDLIAVADYLKSGTIIAINNHYTKPIINNKLNNKSFVNVKNLRHPLIELINNNTEYVPIDISLGENTDGILLFGLNSSGKSSLQKSIGIGIIMAQMGYYVSASHFEYYPYKTLMTRINSNDNLFKGLSSFALELVELRAILKRANSNTLVIADEVCKGTEHQSSLIIVMAMIETLCKNNTSFITATHLHELTKMDRINEIDNLAIKHLHIDYNEKTNELIYERKLKDGPGENFYGLNLAKYFISDNNFLTLANDIKTDLFNDQLVINKTSNYNNDVYMDNCFICKYKPLKNEIPLETHHIVFQKDFKNGVCNTKLHLKKNHKSNLVVLCYKCHDEIDRNNIIIKNWKETNNGNNLDYCYTNQ
jgi:DNA mismatch repair protein MutS